MRRVLPSILAGLLATAAAAQTPASETTRIADGVYQFRYRSHNSFFVVTGDGVLAFDPISKEAASVYAGEIRRIAPDEPLRVIIYSHHHADHVTGAPVLAAPFGGEVPIIAHENAYAKLAARPTRDLPPPDVTFADRMTIHLGTRPVELRYLGKSHSDNLIVAYLPNEKIVFAVDFVSHDAVGYRDLPDFHFPDFFEALRRLQELDYETIVFGHGPPGTKASVDRQIEYYGDLRAEVRRAFERGASEDEAAAGIDLPRYQNWRGYGDWFELNVRALYRWIASGGDAAHGEDG